MKRCPRCSSEVSVLDKACPRCGLSLEQMEEFKKNFAFDDENNNEQDGVNERPLSKKELKKQEKERKKAEKKSKKEAAKNYVNDTDFAKYATNSGEENEDVILETDTYAERKRKKKRQQAKPVFEIDENGEFHIDTKSVELVGEKTGKLLEERYEQSYSIKKSRGDYVPPKIKWWEIYKLADRHFARGKIKKEVNKAAKIKPSFVKKSKLILLSFFLGWCGAHNFYAKNKKKGWVSVFCLLISITVVSLSTKVTFFNRIVTSVGGGCGFVFSFIWISDFINIITNQFKYRVQIDKFISSMNVETRAKLGEKYIDLDLYHKPWWVRFKVWCRKQKRNYQQSQKERRQRNIDRQKRKLAEMEEKERIEREVAEFEEKQDRLYEETKKPSNLNSIIDEKTLSELESFGEDDSVSESSQNEDTSSEEVKNEDVETENNSETSEENAENGEPKRERKVGNLYQNKYARFSNKKSSKKKKKK